MTVVCAAAADWRRVNPSTQQGAAAHSRIRLVTELFASGPLLLGANSKYRQSHGSPL